MINTVKKPIFTISIAVYMILFFAAPGIAGMVDSSFHNQKAFSRNIRQEKIQTIQRALENKIVKDKLKAYGLNENEIDDKLKSLSDAQIHILAQASEKILAGGDVGLSTIVTLLLIILLVVLILRLT